VDDSRAVFRDTQINLGIGFASPSLTLTTVKARDFECPGAGACYLTTYNWELANLYEVGKEILCYRSVEELVEMYSYYRKRPKQCLDIARAAWRRCQNEHTWEKRFRKIFMEAGFKVQP
jgi:spore maturation protein CgeB